MAVLVFWFVTSDFLSRHVLGRVQFLKKKKRSKLIAISVARALTHVYAIYDFLPINNTISLCIGEILRLFRCKSSIINIRYSSKKKNEWKAILGSKWWWNLYREMTIMECDKIQKSLKGTFSYWYFQLHKINEQCSCNCIIIINHL